MDAKEIDDLLSNKKAFEDFIYTPLPEALRLLEERKSNLTLRTTLKSCFSGILPPLADEPRLTLLRYILTPNYEILRFLHLTQGIEGYKPLICEYPNDRFFPGNISKRLLGKPTFFLGRDRNGCLQTERIEIIDFSTAGNRKLNEIDTLWGQKLNDFHHELFASLYPHLSNEMTYDVSEWYTANGPSAKSYYAPLLSLFVQNGVLFENFVLGDKHENPFIREIFLPAFLQVLKSTGCKPLIVALEPTEIEGDKFWLCYPPEGRELVKAKLMLK